MRHGAAADRRSGHDRSVVVIGGGVMGTSTLYHLARAGLCDTTLLEADVLAGGSSGKPLGGVRAQFSDPANIALGHRSLAAYARFSDELGVDIGFEQVGYLFALRAPADVAPFEASIALQRSMGVRSELLTVSEARVHCPYLDPVPTPHARPAFEMRDGVLNEVLAAAWSPDSGFARPGAVVQGYATAAAALGAEVRTHASVVGIEGTGDGRALVTTDDGSRYRAGAVVCTAGAWSGQLAASVGVDLPITPLRRQIAFTPPVPDRPPRLPFTIDYSSTAYFHGTEDGGLLLGWADPDQPPGYDRSVSNDWHVPLRRALSRFAPALVDVPIVDGWAGLYEMTPDCNALVGEADPGFRFLYAAGFSGHGFLQGPAVGEVLAARLLGRPPPVDVSCFDASRFRHAPARTELGII
jgi:sarcosine oxidase subunit beta